MDSASLIAKLEKELPGAVLEKGQIGRQGLWVVWLEARSLLDAARSLKEGAGLDRLENFSMMQMDDAFVATYFVAGQASLFALRVSVVPDSPAALVELPSATAIWPMAAPFEREIADLFGVRFMNVGRAAQSPSSGRLPAGWQGFPLRKDYAFPKEFGGILHARPLGRPGASE